MNMLRRLHFALAVVLIIAFSPALAQTQDDLRKAQELYERAMQKKESAARIQLLQQAGQLLSEWDQPSAWPPALLAQAATLHYNLGREFCRQAKWPLAVVHLEEAYALDSRFGGKDHLRLMAQAHNGLALQHLNHGKPEHARQSALAAIRCDSTFMAAHTTLGLALFQQRNYEKAIAAYQKVLQANPTAQLYNNLGAAQEAKGELAAAVEAYRRALELEIGLASAQKNLQRAQEKLAMAGDAEKPATVDTLRAIPIRRDSLMLAAPALAERSSKSRRAKGGKVEPAAQTLRQLSSKLAVDTKARRHGRTSEKSPLPSTPLAATAPNSSMPSPADSAAASATPPRLSIPSVKSNSSFPVKSLALASAVVLMILAFAQRHRLSHVWLQLQPVLATSTAEISHQVRRLLSRIWRNLGVTGKRESEPIVVAKEEKIIAASAPALANENLEPRQPTLQTQAFFAEMIAAEPEIEDFEDEADAPSSANGHIDSPPTLPDSDKVANAEISLRTPAPALVSITGSANNGLVLLPTPASVSNAAVISKTEVDANAGNEKSNSLDLNNQQRSIPTAAANSEQAARAVETTGGPPPLTNNQSKRSGDPDISGQSALGRYLIEREIGKGAMGSIYLAWDPKLDRRVVIKTVCFTLATSEVDTSTLKDRVYREARAIARLGHPNIVVVYDVEDGRDMSYIVMEHIEGRDLRQALQSERRFDCPRAIKIMAQVCSALDYAHSAGIIHRDIKPSNIMLLPGDKAKVTDFGIAKIADNFALTLPGHILGTPSYMAPEQFEGDEIDGRADLFSLGVVLYELITGCRPFTGDSLASLAYKIVHKMHLPPSLQNVELPLELDEIVGKALAKNPQERYATAMEFREALLGAQAESSADLQSANI